MIHCLFPTALYSINTHVSFQLSFVKVFRHVKLTIFEMKIFNFNDISFKILQKCISYIDILMLMHLAQCISVNINNDSLLYPISETAKCGLHHCNQIKIQD